MTETRRQLKQISPEKIRRNPDNPRLFFRTEELDTLAASIRRYGIQVPLTVFEDDGAYVLLDGERRWKCALKLNLPTVPALVQAKPDRLQNILLMFNIHALREQWDYLTIANKLPSVIELHKLQNYGVEPTEAQLSELTGLTRGQVRRCRFLIDLPERYRRLLEEELALPKGKQVLSEDFFIEMERALKTVRTRLPAAIADVNQARDVLIQKFRKDVITNITDFRMLSKIATSVSNLGITEAKARQAVKAIIDPDSSVGILAVYSQHFESRYDQRKFGYNVEALYDYLWSVKESDDETQLPYDLVGRLRELSQLIDDIVERLEE